MSKRQILELCIWGAWVIGVAYFGHWAVINNSMLGLGPGLGFYIAGLGIGPPGLYYAARRLENDQKRRIGEEFTKSIDLLGHKYAAVRQGGIYALGFLAQDSKEYHPNAIKIVASYVRGTKTPQIELPDDKLPEANSDKDADDQKLPAQKTDTGRQSAGTGKTDKNINIAPDGVDVEAALSVIKTRKQQWDKIPQRRGEYAFDLSESVLLNGDLSNTSLRQVNLSQIDATRCVFNGTDFKGANMVAAIFRGCEFPEAKFIDAELGGATFDKNCDFNDADFSGARFQDDNEEKVKLHGVDLSRARRLTPGQIKYMDGDENTKLPAGLNPPKRWLRPDSDHSE
ncbi:MAG: pentapeptide repeat-containing protein [Gammaproteobacteria bacterium]